MSEPSKSTQVSSHAEWSFRDPAGSLISVDGRVLRIVNPAFREETGNVLSSRVVQEFVRQGRLVRTNPVDVHDPDLPVVVRRRALENPGITIIEHEVIWFRCFPYEWAPEMLHAGAELTLDLAEGLVQEDLGLKDATPFNILFRGPQPVFIDVSSIECRDLHNYVWLPYAQFVRTFLLPLLINRYLAQPLNRVFTANREGLEPEEVYTSIGRWDRLRPPFLGLVSLPTWLGRRGKLDDFIYRPKKLQSTEQARFVLRGVLRGLRKKLRNVQPSVHKSVWSDYTDMRHYSDQEMAKKLQFVEFAVEQVQARKALDVGCNTGRFSIGCAKKGADVVAIDYDPVVVGRLWRHALVEKLSILPLVVNLAQPTPPTGWRNEEYPSFLDRARGKFDILLMLAVIHHLLVTERVPLIEILQLAAEVTNDAALIEFVPATDPMFRLLLRGRDELHRDFTQESFEQACSKFFRIVRKEELAPGSRCLYLLRK
jgi:SAM-dependent methyltransferase